MGLGAIAAIAGAVALYFTAARPAEPMKPADFARIVRALASDAHESARLAAALRSDRVSGNYAETQRAKLKDDVADTAKKLDGPLPRPLEDSGAKARSLTQGLAAQLQTFQARIADKPALDALQRELQRIGEELARLEPAP